MIFASLLLFPQNSAARKFALVDQSLADGILDAVLLMCYEVVLRSVEW